GDEVPGYRSSVRLPVEEVRDTLSAAWPERSFSDDPLSWFDSLDPNRVRSLLSLRSSHFTVAPEGDTLEFSVTGYGHGVGMSQYGANALAAQGKDYKEILTWYYTGVTIERYG
ncbi:MAG: stage II sporulation protein D, partial [Clostridiales bacterium]|nr:stage II sporulation protein D [Clostridiales bacterium]